MGNIESRERRREEVPPINASSLSVDWATLGGASIVVPFCISNFRARDAQK
jgi:hypothetical protein